MQRYTVCLAFIYAYPAQNYVNYYCICSNSFYAYIRIDFGTVWALLHSFWDSVGPAALLLGQCGPCCTPIGTVWALLHYFWDSVGPTALLFGTVWALLHSFWDSVGPAALLFNVIIKQRKTHEIKTSCV